MPSPSPQPRRSGVAGLWAARGAGGASFISARSTRSYLSRLPVATRLLGALLVAVHVIGWLPAWDLRAAGALVPSKLSLAAMHRTNTYPLLHASVFHLAANVAALLPLLERFEAEHGSLPTLVLFFGPLSQLPAFLYVGFERIVGRDTPVMGASVWVFLLLGIEAIRTFRTNPSLVVGGVSVPTWTTPLFFVFAVAVLVPHTSLVGHLCGLGVGYLCGLGYLKFLSPPETVLRFVETRLNLLVRVPHYVSIDQKTYGRFGVLPTTSSGPGGPGGPGGLGGPSSAAPAIGLVGSTQRLGP